MFDKEVHRGPGLVARHETSTLEETCRERIQELYNLSIVNPNK